MWARISPGTQWLKTEGLLRCSQLFHSPAHPYVSEQQGRSNSRSFPRRALLVQGGFFSSATVHHPCISHLEIKFLRSTLWYVFISGSLFHTAAWVSCWVILGLSWCTWSSAAHAAEELAPCVWWEAKTTLVDTTGWCYCLCSALHAAFLVLSALWFAWNSALTQALFPFYFIFCNSYR